MIDVLIVGAGASGLTMAADLARRGVQFRVIDSAAAGFPGSRAKGVQPRTLEVFDDLGVLPLLEPRSAPYPPLGIHLGPLRLRRTMIKAHQATEDVPHPNTLLAPQYATDTSLRERLSGLGGKVEYSTRLLSYVQDAGGVTAAVEGVSGQEQIRARYLIGADGGSSMVRRGVRIPFVGTTDESDRMIVADVTLTGLSRDRWHIWPRNAGRFMGLCPLPDGKFQLMLKLRPEDPADLTPAAIERMVREFIGRTRIQVIEVDWSSLWRPNIRLAEKYRSGGVFLIGDAAHVHPPAGGQGLNTGVQDAYNLAWKLGQVIAGAPDALLATYEAERQPIAARVLGLSTELYARVGERPLAGTKRGDEERQLSVSYRGGPLAPAQDGPPKTPLAGDRAPDALITDTAGRTTTLFDAFRGPHFTLLAIGSRAVSAAADVIWPAKGAGLRRVQLDGRNDSFRRIYGARGDALILVRPDGYIAARTDGPDALALTAQVKVMLPASSA